MTVKALILFFLATSLILAATSQAAQRSHFVTLSAMQEQQTLQVTTRKKGQASIEEIVHERILRMNNRDYGRYNPSPTLSKPHSKRIPN